ncbi:MAG: nickel-responsive transcriptional regulator NikR [Planctomycetota bacterium]|nr:nickel-responsive transcriptional regulator NikR [Planctomycetota bacterium]
MGGLARFSVSIEKELLERLDSFLERKGYANRSEALRDFIREMLAEEELKNPNASAIAAVSIVYDHHRLELPDRLTELQHEHHKAIASTLHVHIDEHNCLEVVVLRGRAGRLARIADALIGMNGVKFGKVLLTVPGELSS